jgi:plasmid stabilization system protein ParE
MRILFHLEAESDVIQAFRWYEEKMSGLGARFRLSLDAALAAIQAHPEAYPVVHKQVRRALLRRFPYGVFFLVIGEDILVLAVSHASRDPRHWRQR